MSQVNIKEKLKKVLKKCDTLESKIKKGNENLKKMSTKAKQVLTEENEINHEVYLDSIKR